MDFRSNTLKTVVALCAAGVAALTGTAMAQSAAHEYKPAKPGISAGSLTMGKPAAGSLTIGPPRAGSLGGSISAGSMAPAVGQPLSVGVPAGSIGVPLTTENLRTRRLTSDDIDTSRSTRRSRSRRGDR